LKTVESGRLKTKCLRERKFLRGAWIFLFATAPRPALEPSQAPIQWYWGLFPGGEAAGA